MPVTDDVVQHVHVDQVGALKRPAWLIDAFEGAAKGEIGPDALRAAQDRSIREPVARQEALGLPVVTDGEQWRKLEQTLRVAEAVWN